MRVGAAALAGGTFGLLGTLCFLLAFATDYWLLASDDCWTFPTKTTPTSNTEANGTEAQSGGAAAAVSPSFLTLHHEGFFRHCVFQLEPTTPALLATFYTNQPDHKMCIQGYLFPLPVALGQVPHPKYDATAVFRGFWTVLVILGLFSALTGGFLLVCGVPFISHRLYKLGGAFLITAACLFLAMLLLYVLWVEVVDVKSYILQERGDWCLDARVYVHYGVSFMVAAAGVPLEVVSGLVFMLVGRALQARK